MNHVMITGASGFIGKHLARHYLNKGYRVTVFVRDPGKMDEFTSHEGFRAIKSSFDEFDRLADLVGVIDAPDIFYYLAWDGYGKTTNDYRAQVKNIKPVCDAVVEAKKMGAMRFVFAGSLSEFMTNGHACNVYGNAKTAARLIAHSVAAQQDIQFISVAFANVFGVGDTSNRSTNLFIRRLLSGQDIDLTEGRDMYDWVYIDDCIRGLVLAGEVGFPDMVYYIGSRTRRPLKEIVEELRDILAPEAKINYGRYHDDFHMEYQFIDVHLLYKHTGYLAKTDFKDAVLKTAEWLK